ncbi:MAG: threonine synthase [Hyphomicrobiales bacterium]|nr:threonine synthase [Hyphomicrobiales bacterium]
MEYVSTRGEAPSLGFEDVLLTGLARDGGLYVPGAWPKLEPDEIAALAGLPYAQAAVRVMRPFIGGDVPDGELAELADEAYSGFAHATVAPLVQIGANAWVLELFHGPTLAFKDFAMQVLARLMDRALKRRNERATIVTATSGDTGGAAVEAFRGRDAIDIFVLHPHGRVSDVQRRQMTTATESNVHNLAIEGTFDDCQALLKALFNDLPRRDRLSLAAVNSINWARIMAQTVYYMVSAAALGAPGRAVGFSVPTGNFGDVFAGYVAARMGLPVKRLVVATNVNDILARTFASGRYEPRGVVPTTSPSMDIQISSNFERLVFEATGRDSGRVRRKMAALADQGGFDLEAPELDQMRALFVARRVDEDEAAATIRRLQTGADYLADPHTAIGIAAAGHEHAPEDGPIVSFATAHPAKFPDAVGAACGVTPPVPARLAGQLAAEERYTVLGTDYDAVAAFIEARSRAVMEPQ